MNGPAFKCSWPSRKFPCKHALGLLLLRAESLGAFSSGDPPGWVTEWLEAGREREEKKKDKVDKAEGTAGPEAPQRRIAARKQKVLAGIEELDLWLADFLRRGFSGIGSEDFAFFESMAARLVDAQVPVLARLVRGVGEEISSGIWWEDRALERVGNIYLLLQAYRGQSRLTDGLRGDVRPLVGWSVDMEAVLTLLAVRTKLVVFDTSVVDMTEQREDPVEVLFGVQIGGGTDINRAVGYCQSLVESPTDTIMVLISDLYEGGVEEELIRRVGTVIASGVQVIVLLAPSDEGAPAFDDKLAMKPSGLAAPSFLNPAVWSRKARSSLLQFVTAAFTFGHFALLSIAIPAASTMNTASSAVRTFPITATGIPGTNPWKPLRLRCRVFPRSSTN